MNLIKSCLHAAACGVTFMALAVNAHAQLTGTAYIASGSAAQFASASEFTAASSSGVGYTFSLGTDNINFSASAGSGYTGAGFVGSGGGTITGSTGGGSTAAMATGPFGCSGGCTSTIMEISGTYVGGAHTLSITHDDGIAIYIGGVLQDPGDGSPTSAEASTVNLSGAAGSTFTLVYDECCGAPAVLNANLTPLLTATPEPGSIGLLATSLIGAGLFMRKRRQNA